MNKDCAMARDLMPLVIDNVASEESREFVEKHLAGCGECSAVYEEMKKEAANGGYVFPHGFGSRPDRGRKARFHSDELQRPFLQQHHPVRKG